MATGRALVLGSNAGQADLIRYLKSTGWRVDSCGYRREGPGVYLADEFHNVDIADESAVANLVKAIDAELVYSVSSDIAIRTATNVAFKLGLPVLHDPELVDLLHFKDRLRHHLDSLGIEKTRYSVISEMGLPDLGTWDSFPCVIKPLDAQGQRGVSVAYEPESLQRLASAAIGFSPSNTAIVEEFLEGNEFSANVLVSDGRIVVNVVTERLVHPPPHYGIPFGHLIPPRTVDGVMLEEMKSYVEKVVDSFAVSKGVFYLQFKATSDGPRIIEIAPRLDGCHIWRLIQHACGFDLIDLTVRLLKGDPLPPFTDSNPTPHGLFFYQARTGSRFNREKVVSHSNKEPVYEEFRYCEGEAVAPVNGELEVVGYCIVSN